MHIWRTLIFCSTRGGDSWHVSEGSLISFQRHWSVHFNGNTGPTFSRISSAEDCSCCTEGKRSFGVGVYFQWG